MYLLSFITLEIPKLTGHEIRILRLKQRLYGEYDAKCFSRLLSMTLKKIENTNGTEVVSVIDLQTATLLNLLAFLTSHGSFKAAMLAVVRYFKPLFYYFFKKAILPLLLMH